MKEYQHITHDSIKPYINEDSTILILGSLPSVKSREENFYYAYKSNRFYKVLSIVFNDEEPLSIDDKKAFLKRHHIALYDVIKECDIIGSSDSSIKNVIPIDISVDILSKAHNIKTIILTGKLAKDLFDKYLIDNVPKYIKVYGCPSTSAANASYTLDMLVNDYYKCLLKS